jgi:hypothetical protein
MAQVWKQGRTARMMLSSYDIPEGVSHYEECNILLIGSFEDVIAAALDHLAVSQDDFAAIEGFLLLRNSRIRTVSSQS